MMDGWMNEIELPKHGATDTVEKGIQASITVCVTGREGEKSYHDTCFDLA